MKLSDSNPVSNILKDLDIPHRIFIHPGPIISLEQAAQERGQRPEQIVRSILFRMGSEQYIMVLTVGNQQVSWPKLRKYLGTNRITMAESSEVLRITGYQTGAVSPIRNPQPLRILADPSVFIEDEISIGSGLRGTTVILQSSNLRKALSTIEIVPLTDAANASDGGI